MEREYGRIYSNARDWRKDQDYSITAGALTQPIVTQIIADAERFVAHVEQYLRGEGAL